VRISDADKFQIPSTKFQTSTIVQNTNVPNKQIVLDLPIGIWDLFGIWKLRFGISVRTSISQ
jgi:hypothetical protein